MAVSPEYIFYEILDNLILEELFDVRQDSIFLIIGGVHLLLFPELQILLSL